MNTGNSVSDAQAFDARQARKITAICDRPRSVPRFTADTTGTLRGRTSTYGLTDLNSSATRVPRSVFFALFAVSGFAGLIYESIWTHYLKLFLGHAAYAQTLVLALFMGGMAIGAWLCSRAGGRWTNLLAGYAIAEALIGIAALVFHPLFVATTDAAFDSLLPALGNESLATLAKWTLGSALILPQSILLGMTFPLMSAGIIRRYPLAPGESLAMLYFTNSFGAAVGVLASGFILIDHLGLPGTMQTAGVLNLVLAGAVWMLTRGGEPGAAPVQKNDSAGSTPALFLVVALLTGTASFIYEIGWIRMLSLVLGASTHSFELMLSSFILGLAFGGLWVRKRIDSIAEPIRWLGTVQVAMGLLALATIPVYGQMFGVMQAVIKGLAKTDAGHVMFLASSHGIALAVMFPATFCAGMTLPLITYVLLRSGQGEKAIGAVYASNTLGSILGVVLAAHIGMPYLGLKGLIVAGALIDVTLGLVLLWRYRASLFAPVFATAVVLLGFAVVVPVFSLDAHKMASGVFRRGDLFVDSDVKVISHRDGKTTTVSMLDFSEGRSLRTNGKSDGAINMNPLGARISDELTMVLTAALPLAYKPDAKHAAIIGIGTGLTTHTMVSSPTIEEVDTIEIEPAMAEASRLFAPVNANAFADPRSHIIFDDAKTYFSTRNRKYDIIVSEPSNPWVSGVSSLFTREFYRHTKRYLKPGGVLVQWFQLYEIDPSLVGSVLLSLGAEFPDYVIYMATESDLLIIAGDPETLARPLADVTKIAGLSDELQRIHVNTLGDIQMRRLGGKAALDPFFRSYKVPGNSDFQPYLDLNAAKFRFLQRYAGEVTEIDSASGIPVLSMLEGRVSHSTIAPSLGGEDYLDRIEQTRRALYARNFFLSPVPPDPVSIPRNFQKDLELTQLRLIDCRNPERFDIWFHSLYTLARAVNPYLSAVDADQLWTKLIAHPCGGKIPEAQQKWLDLYLAIGRRDAQAMTMLSESLLSLSTDLPKGNRQFLITAAMTGHLMRKDKAGAAAVWSRHPKDVDGTTDVTLRFLYAHAF